MSQSNSQYINYSIDAAVFIIQINRPEKKNALLPDMYRALGDGLKMADADPSINCIVIRGCDDCFTSGNDVSGFVGRSDSDEERPSVYFMRAIHTTVKPVIAAVSGLAIGIGTTLLFHCDLIYASQDCFLQLPFTRLGLCPEAGSSWLLPQQIGHVRASELMLLGDRISASKAKEYGIINEVLPQSEYLQFALMRAKEIAALPPQGVQVTKALLKRDQGQAVTETIELELVKFAELLETDEAQAIVQAFLNRKK
ncbi:MAG: enoyl-CoA hydratase [SAR86 cluster bacterium]|uniref:Enoyl-CoA hydratase n=1 Tax=SAR86 cluster bacterium TaxID=2030880 RepID=A0A2A4MJF5_9GAMM|nr:MAG: enoyl-CoA hydratase [SAR86 cluster bacterium]